MLGKTRTSLLSLAVIAVLIFSAIGPTIVYADGDNPPTTTTDTIVEQDDGDNHSGACDSDKEGGKNKKGKKNKSGGKHSNICSSAEETADTSEGEGESSAADTSGGESAPDGAATDATGSGDSAKAAPADLLSQVPENTSVTVLNADGQAEPLATQEAANAIASTTDPIWCPEAPAGQPPTPPIPGANNCTPSFTSFTLLLTFLAGKAAT